MTEWAYSRAEIERGQLETLQGLLSEVVPANSFYTQKFRASGVTPEVTSLKAFGDTFPFTTKAELVQDQKKHPPYGTNLTYPLSSYTRCHQTSGSTGMPLRWLDNGESWQAMLDNWRQVYAAAGVTVEDRLFFAFSFGPFLGFWTAFESALQIGCLCLPGGGLSSVGRLQAILEHGATVLCCTPTYAIHLAEVADREGIDLNQSDVRKLIVAGEPGGSLPAVRRRLETLWPKARVFDHHGMTEVGPVTFECPQRPGVLQVIESAYLAEVVDPESGSPVESGQNGELILTTLKRSGSPLIRYRTGDLVRRIPPERLAEDAETDGGRFCGPEHFCLDGGILGRVDDMVVVRGVNLYPSAVDEVVRGFDGITEYQVQVNSSSALTEIQVDVEPKPEVSDVEGLTQRVERALHSAFNLRMPVQAVPANSLPRFELKAKRWRKQ